MNFKKKKKNGAWIFHIQLKYNFNINCTDLFLIHTQNDVNEQGAHLTEHSSFFVVWKWKGLKKKEKEIGKKDSTEREPE